MASTTVSPRSPAASGPGRAAPSLVSGGGRQRRWSLALLAVLITLGSALAFVVLWMNAGGRKPVLALRHDVAAGQVIRAEDLSVVRVAADSGIRPLASSARDDVIGKPAATDLLAGTLLVPASVGSGSGLAAGTAVVAVPVPVDELPSPDLETGDRVLLYRTVTGQAGDAASAETIGDGRVFAVGSADRNSSNIRVSVTVDESLVPDIAAAIQSDDITLALAANRP